MKYSKHGYKRNSKDKNRPYNVIPSGRISMKDVDFPVMGIDDLGYSELMTPGGEYKFPGSTVLEIPIAQYGKDFIMNMGDVQRAKEEDVDADYKQMTTLSTEDEEIQKIRENINYTPNITKEDVELYYNFIPVTGEVIDAKNTGKALGEGKLGEAVLHALGFAIPFIPGGALVKGLKKGKNKLKKGLPAPEFPLYRDRPVILGKDYGKPGNPFVYHFTRDKDHKLDWEFLKKGTTPGYLEKLGVNLKKSGITLGTPTHGRYKGIWGFNTQYPIHADPYKYDAWLGKTNRGTRTLDPWGNPKGYGHRVLQYQFRPNAKILDLSDRGTAAIIKNAKHHQALLDEGYDAILGRGETILLNANSVDNVHEMRNLYDQEMLKEFSDLFPVFKKEGGELPKAQYGKDLIMDMQNAARLNEAGYDTTLNDLQSYQDFDGNLEHAEMVASIFPGLGEFIDAKNTIKATYQGRYGDAVLNAAGFMIPFIPGKVLTKGKKAVTNWMNKNAPNAYKYNPWAFGNINSKLPKWMQRNPMPEDVWNRQVGRDAIVDANKTRTVRDIGENIDKEYYDHLVERLNNYHRGSATGFNPDYRYPGPFFQKGSLFHKMTKDYKGTKLKGKTNTRGRSGSANYLIQTNPKFITDEDFHQAYMKQMFYQPDPVGDWFDIGSDAIMKPQNRDISNFNFFEKDWWEGYKPLKELPNKKTGAEIPIAQDGIEVPKRKGVRLNYDKEGNVIGESTHIMKTEQLEDGTWVSFPSLFQNENEEWIDMSKETNWMKIYEEAKRRGEVINFGDDKEAALAFGKGSWKPDLPQLVIDNNIKGAHYDPHPLVNTIYMNQNELDAGNVLPHEMYHWKQRNSGEMFENPLLQSHPVGPVTAESILNVYYNRRKHDQLREAQMMANALGPDAQFIPNFIYDHSERYMYGNPNAAEGEAVMFESLYKDNKKYLEHEAEVLKNAIYKQNGGTTDSIPNVEVILNNPNISMPIDTILPTNTIMNPNCDPGSACYDFFISRRDALLKGDTSNPTDSMVVDTVQPNLINFMPPPSVNKKRPEEMMKLKAGGALPKAQKGNEAIMIMGDAARANEAGLDVEYSDLRGDQNLTADQAELIGGFYPFLGEAIDAKNVLKSLYEGNLGDAALHAAGFALPFVPGKAVKKGFDAGWDKVKGWWRGADNAPYQKMFDDRTIPVRGGVQFDDGIGEYNSLKSMHTLYPDNVVEPLDLIMDDGVAVGYNMRNIDGEDLLTWTKNNKFSQEMYDEIATVIDDLNSKGLYHGDLNAQNIMIDNSGNWRIIDPVGFEHSSKMSEELLEQIKGLDSKSLKDLERLIKKYGGSLPKLQLNKKYGGSLPKAQRGLHGGGIYQQGSKETKGKDNKLFNLINNIFTHGKGIATKGLNQHIFDYVRPGVYPSDTKSILYELLYDDKEGYSSHKGSKNKYLGNIFKEDPFLDYEGNYNIDEEAYRMALGLDVKNKWFEESAYRPSISNDPESKYYSSPVFNWDGLLDYINLNKYSGYDAKDRVMLRDRMNEMDLYVKDETGNLVVNKDIGSDAIGHLFAHANHPFEEHDSENVQWTHIVRDGEYWPHKALGKDGYDPYAKIKISLAEDEKGTYLSYYDKYDFKNDYINQLIEAGGGNPVEFYDKKYVEFDNDGRLIFKKQGGSLLEIEDGKEITVDFNQLEKGIRYAESLNGELMKNPESSASGLYQQLFDEIEYDGTRDEFIADTDYQKELFRKRAHGEMENVPGLMDNGIEVYNEYKDQVDLNKHGLTPLTIAGLSNMLGRQGTRKYIGYVLRDGDPIEEIFPHLYGEFAEYKNHTPTEYIEKFNKGLLEKKEGGQINNKIKRLKQQLQLYKNGKEMSSLAERELIALGLIKPKMQTGGSYTVKRGDRLGRIASDNNMTLEELITLNPQFKDNPGEIYPGQKVYFNSEERIIDNESKTNLMHVIKKGETLSEIATRYGLDYIEIAKLNNIKNPGMVRAGTSIKIPSTAKIDRNNEKIQKQEKIANSPYNDHNIIILNDDGIANQTWVKRAFVYDWDPNSPTYGQSVWKNIEGKRNIIKDINQKEEQVDRIVSGINNNYTGTYKENEYIVKPNDNLSTIAKNNNTSLSKLIKDNNITNKDQIQIGQKLKIIKSDAQPYLILDDKNGRLHVYYPGDEDPRYSYPVLTGAMEGDQQTQTKVAFYKDGEKLSTQQINEAVEKYDLNNVNELLNLPGYKSQVDWDMGNKITGAGIYEIDIVNEDGGMYDETGQGRTTPSFTFTNESGISVPMVIHGGTYSRRDSMQNIENLSPEETKVSNGCINGRCSDLRELYSLPGIGKGTQMYVLPEEKGNNFVYENGKINFYSSRDNQQIANAGYATQSGEFVAGGPGMNVTKEFHNYKPINITFDKSFYEKNSKRYDGSPQQEEYEFVTNTQPFLNSIVDNKKMMMEKLNIDGDLYNDLAMIAFGIYGYESGMGDINNSVENSVKFGTKAGGALYNKFSNITNQYLGLDIGSIGSQSSPDVQSKYDTYGQRGEDNSVGWTQIRWNERDESELEALRKVGITNQEQLMDPANSAKATIAILAKEYQNQISGPQKNSSSFDIFTELPKKYSPTGGDNYADMVNQYMQYIDLSETDIDDLDNNLIIKGEYTIDARDRSTKLTDAIDEIGGVEKKPGNSILGDIIDWSLNKTQEQKKADINNAVTNTVEGVKEWWDNVDLNPFWKLGGEFSLRNQHQFYNDYINGVYKNTKQEKNANKLFDKINRMYYNDSKKSGMHQLDVLRKAIGSQSVKQ